MLHVFLRVICRQKKYVLKNAIATARLIVRLSDSLQTTYTDFTERSTQSDNFEKIKLEGMQIL